MQQKNIELCIRTYVVSHMLQRFVFLTFFKLDTLKIESLVNRPESLKLDCDDEVLVITIQLQASVTFKVEFDTEGYVTVIVRG